MTNEPEVNESQEVNNKPTEAELNKKLTCNPYDSDCESCQ
jgi:hypothetical protein